MIRQLYQSHPHLIAPKNSRHALERVQASQHHGSVDKTETEDYPTHYNQLLAYLIPPDIFCNRVCLKPHPIKKILVCF